MSSFTTRKFYVFSLLDCQSHKMVKNHVDQYPIDFFCSPPFL